MRNAPEQKERGGKRNGKVRTNANANANAKERKVPMPMPDKIHFHKSRCSAVQCRNASTNK